MIDSKQRVLMEELRVLQQQNQRLKDAMSFQEITLRKQIRQKNKIYAIYLNLSDQRKKQTQILSNSLLSDSPSMSESKLMGSFRSTEPDSIGKQKPRGEKHKLKIIVDHGEVKSIKGKSIEKSVSQKTGYTTLKELRQIQQNRQSTTSTITTPISSNGRKKKSYFQKLAEQNSA